jgi:hypothetical protein
MALAALLPLLAACAGTKEARVRSSLTQAGLPAATAACMAPPLARDLSTSQLQALGRLGRTLSDDRRQLSEREALELLRRDLDPAVVGVVIRAGLGCIMRG